MGLVTACIEGGLRERAAAEYSERTVVLAAGVPRMFASIERSGRLDNSVMVLGYVIMRVALVFQRTMRFPTGL